MVSESSGTGAVVVISGPSGSGKTTILKRVLDKDPELVFSVSATTREARTGEVDGVDYVFLSRDEFGRKIAVGEFAEYAESFGNYYGTPAEPLREAIESGRVIILDIDLQGVRQIKENVPGVVFVMITPPDVDSLVERLRERRSETEEQLALRIERARSELDCAEEYDHVIVNDDLDTAVAQMRDVIKRIKESLRGKGLRDG